MQRTASIALLIFFLASLTTVKGAASASDCVELHYGSAQVRLTGKVSRRTFAGPPNYLSVLRGDRPEAVWVLGLTKPVCVSPLAADQENEAANNVGELQLVIADDLPDKQANRFSSRQVIVTGRLFSAQSGHHHTKVLLEVDGIRSEP
ncbi:MAG: DUF4431 domain-containing protein [Nitrospirae bacterium]|nr:DUF4431 domain-containing protein [Nitrospirota bacterium]